MVRGVPKDGAKRCGNFEHIGLLYPSLSPRQKKTMKSDMEQALSTFSFRGKCEVANGLSHKFESPFVRETLIVLTTIILRNVRPGYFPIKIWRVSWNERPKSGCFGTTDRVDSKRATDRNERPVALSKAE